MHKDLQKKLYMCVGKEERIPKTFTWENLLFYEGEEEGY